MMTNKQFKEKIELIGRVFCDEKQELYQQINKLEDTTKDLKEENESLKRQLAQAQDLKGMLSQMTELTNKSRFAVGAGLCATFSPSGSTQVALDDSVAVYVDDFFGGKVIKQEATKLLCISESGKVTEHHTKQKADKGYSYKLVRE